MTAAQSYVPVSRRALDLEDYILIARRHSGWIFGPLYAGLVISTVLAFSMQNVYESNAKMQIRPSQIPENLVQTTINERLEERIRQIYSQVTSRQSLSTLIHDPKLNLYPDERQKEPDEDIEDEMRKDIHLTFSSETRGGGAVFGIAFQYRRKNQAHDTVAALVTRFIDESQVSQRSQQHTATEFFSDELSQAKNDLEKKNEMLTEFRKQNEGRLPEQEGLNVAQMTALESQISSIQQDLSRLANERLQIENQIQYLKGQMQLTDMLADDSPGMTSPAYRQNEELVGINREIDGDKLKLQELLQTFKSTYPDIRGLQNRIAVLEKRRDALIAQQEKERAEEAAKPALQQKKGAKTIASQHGIQGEIDKQNVALVTNQRDQEFKRHELEEKSKQIDSYHLRLAQTSALEAQNADLRRDVQLATERYEKAQRSQEVTKETADLANRGATETLEELDSPTSPQKPISPKRPQIVGAGVALSLLIGLALAGVQEAKDTSLKNLKDVRAYTNLPVLCSIPLLENTLLVKRKRRITYLAWAAAILLGIVAIGASMFYYFSVISVS